MSEPQLSLLCWYTQFWALPLYPGDESPTSMERQLQTHAASRLHAAVTSSPDRKIIWLTITRLATPQSSGGIWRILTRLLWWIKDKQEVTDFVMNSPSCIFRRDLEASRSPALQNYRALSAYWCPAQRPPTMVLTWLCLPQQTDVTGTFLQKSKLSYL